MTLQQQAFQEIQALPDEKLPSLIQFARFLQWGFKTDNASSAKKQKPVRKLGRLKGEIWMADDFNETPLEFKEYM